MMLTSSFYWLDEHWCNNAWDVFITSLRDHPGDNKEIFRHFLIIPKEPHLLTCSLHDGQQLFILN